MRRLSHLAILLVLVLLGGCIFDDSGNDKSDGVEQTNSEYWVVRAYENDEDSSMLYLSVDRTGDTFTVSGELQSNDGVTNDSTFVFSSTHENEDGIAEPCIVAGTIRDNRVTGLLSGQTHLMSLTGTILPKASNTDFLFPLTVGTTWEYEGAIYEIDFPGDNSEPDTVSTSTSTSEMTISRTERLHETLDTYVFHETISSLSDGIEGNFQSETYYMLADDGLYRMAYEKSGYVAPKASAAGWHLFGGSFMPGATPTTGAIPDGPRWLESTPPKALPHYLTVGTQWIFANNSMSGIEKEMVGRETVHVPAGDFECYKIQNRYPYWDENIIGYDYIASIGLVKRTLSLTPDTTNGQTQNIYYEEHVLTAY